jgi:hypothetical protein
MEVKTKRRLICIGLGILVVQAGCSDAGNDRSYSEIVPDTEASPKAVQQDHADHGASLHWHGPAGWETGPASGIRLASFQIDSETLCTIVSLEASAGDLEANVIRWLGQVGITDPNDSDLQDIMEAIETVPAQDGIIFKVVDLTGLTPSGNSTIGSIAHLSGKTLFVKLTGPVEKIKALKGAYLELLQSFHFILEADPHAGQDPAQSAAQPATRRFAPLVWAKPATWQETAGTGIRLVTFHPEPEDGTVCYITRVEGDVGGLERNVQWWANQLGITLAGDSLAAFLTEQQTIQVNGDSYRIIDYTGLDQNPDSESMIVAVAFLPSSTTVVKMNGTRENLSTHKAAFMELVNSLTTTEK